MASGGRRGPQDAKMLAWLTRALGVPTAPEKAARKYFEASNPGVRVSWTTLAADEGTRCVVGVFYDWGGVPPRYRFYAVEKATLAVEELPDDSPYRPQVWR
jgi:hypothetical protein